MEEQSQTSEGPALPPSLAVTPNIPWDQQTVEQLRAELDHWILQRDTAVGVASAKAAAEFAMGCEAWLVRREGVA